MHNQEREPNNWCEVAGQKCYMNYCDENGCQDRKRNYTEFGLSLLHDEDLQKHLAEQEYGSDQYVLTVEALLSRGLVPCPPSAPTPRPAPPAKPSSAP